MSEDLDPDPIAAEYLAAAREELAWLTELGYEETGLRTHRSGFSVQMVSEKGRVSVSLTVPRDDRNIMLAPPAEPDWHKPIDHLREPRGALSSLLAVYGFAPPGPGRSVEDLRRAVRSLRKLQDTVLAGDWSRFEKARAWTRARRAESDARTREILRGLGYTGNL